MNISNNAGLIFNGSVTLNATNLTIDSGAFISADGKGYRVETGPGAGATQSKAGAGIGFNLGSTAVDYAFMPYGDLGNTHRISLIMKF